MGDAPRASLGRARAALGFVLAPIVPGLFFALPHLWAGDQLTRTRLGFSAAVGYPILLILGVPLYFLFGRRGWTGLPLYAAVGAVFGLVAYFVAAGSGLLTHTFGMLALLSYLPIGVLSGVLALTVFWLIARPDRNVG